MPDMDWKELADNVKIRVSVSIPDGMTVDEVNRAGDEASAARAAEREKETD